MYKYKLKIYAIFLKLLRKNEVISDKKIIKNNDRLDF